MANGVVELDLMAGGSQVAVDNLGGTQHQYVKMEFGASGAATPVDSSNPLPTTVISGTTAITGGVAVSTPGTITSGSIAVTAGTVGTVGAVGQVHNAGTMAGGTLGVVQSVSQVVTGTIANSGTVTGVGVVTSLTNGTVRIPAGTVAVSTPGTITSGTVAINAGTVGGKAASGAASVANPVQIAGTDSGGTIYSPLINTAGAGTQAGVGTVPGVGVVTTVSNLTNGTVRVTAGTINSGTINAGTINAGTINAGTINAGTIKINPRPSTNLLTIGSVWGTNSGTAGTIVAAPGASTVLMINELSIVNEGTSTLTAGMGFGTNQQGTVVLTRAAMAGNGGIQKSYPKAVGGSHANLPLVIWTTGSGTASFTVSYWSEAQ